MARKRKKYAPKSGPLGPPSPAEDAATIGYVESVLRVPQAVWEDPNGAMTDAEWESLVATGKALNAKKLAERTARMEELGVWTASKIPSSEEALATIERIRGKLVGVAVDWNKGWECNYGCHCCEEVDRLKAELERFINGES